MLGLAGVTVIEFRTAAVTVRVVVPSFSEAGSTALIVVAPTTSAVANPLEPATLLILAMALGPGGKGEELHVTDDVRFLVV